MEEVEHIFNAMYHPDCIYIDRDGNKKNREEMKKIHEEKLVMGSKITPLLFKLTGFDTMEVKYKLTNDEEEKVVHQHLTTDENDKIVKCKITIEAELSPDEIVRRKLSNSNFPKKKRQSEELSEEEDDNDEQGQENKNKRRRVKHGAGAPPQHKMTPAALHE